MSSGLRAGRGEIGDWFASQLAHGDARRELSNRQPGRRKGRRRDSERRRCELDDFGAARAGGSAGPNREGEGGARSYNGGARSYNGGARSYNGGARSYIGGARFYIDGAGSCVG
jgi:hypothetical protein